MTYQAIILYLCPLVAFILLSRGSKHSRRYIFQIIMLAIALVMAVLVVADYTSCLMAFAARSPIFHIEYSYMPHDGVVGAAFADVIICSIWIPVTAVKLVRHNKTKARHRVKKANLPLENRPWKVLKSERIIDRGPWLSVRQECVELPNGNQIPTWYILDFMNWVNVIAITKDDKMILIDQYRHGIGETHYELCAGCVDEGESPMDAAKRELLEETGFGGGEWSEFMVAAPNPSNQSNWSYTFLAVGVEQKKEQQLEPTEDIRVHVLKKEKVWRLLQAGEIVSCHYSSALWKYFAMNY